MEHNSPLSSVCLVLDSGSLPLARAVLLSPPTAQNIQLRVLDGKVDDVLEHEELQLVCMAEGTAPVLGRILRHRGDLLVLEPLQTLGRELRQNLRMPVRFDTFIYPLSGTWRGRAAVRGRDLSCGGVAFFSGLDLEPGELVEIVIPLMADPLLLKCKILRQRPSRSPTRLYAAEFADMIEDEERKVREAVFNIQILNRDQPSPP